MAVCDLVQTTCWSSGDRVGSLLASAVRVGPQGGELGGLLGDGEELNRSRKDQELESGN